MHVKLLLSAVPLLTLFVLDDVLVLLVHDGASEAVLRPERRRKRHCYVPRKRGDITILILLIRIRSSACPASGEYLVVKVIIHLRSGDYLAKIDFGPFLPQLLHVPESREKLNGMDFPITLYDARAHEPRLKLLARDQGRGGAE